jgi:hypothetical protein
VVPAPGNCRCTFGRTGSTPVSWNAKPPTLPRPRRACASSAADPWLLASLHAEPHRSFGARVGRRCR